MPETGHGSSALLDTLEVLLRRRRLIVTNCAVVVAAALVVSLLLPKWYRTSAVILPPEQSLDPLTTLGALQMTAATANLPWFATASDVSGAVLQSRSVSEAIIDRFNLKRVYRTRSLDKTVRKLEKHRSVQVTDEGLIRVTVEARNPQQAADMANAFLEVLDEFNRETRMTEGKKTRIFVEERLARTTEDLAAAEGALESYQETHGAVELTEQTRALIRSAAELESEVRAIDIQLATLRAFATEDYPEVRQLRTRRGSLETQLEDLLGRSDLAGALLDSDSTQLFPSLSRIPTLGIEYVRLLRDVELLTKVHAFLTQEVERAKIMESRDTPTIQVLDRASPPEKKSRPRRAWVVLIAGAAALAGSVALAFGLDQADRWLVDPDRARRVEAIRRALEDDWNQLRRRTPGRAGA
jgi:tyrosine-protein kinase Etk/Wzc